MVVNMDVDGQRNDTIHDSADQKMTRDAEMKVTVSTSGEQNGARRMRRYTAERHCTAHDGRRHGSRADSIGMLWGEQTRTRSREGGDDCGRPGRCKTGDGASPLSQGRI
jgi:hypothetical protein